jgi:antitoxin component YwqK of YwqJK toxin-antitoxin module
VDNTPIRLSSFTRTDVPLNNIQSDCGAYIDRENSSFVNEGNCSAFLWLKDIPQNSYGKNAYRFTMEFELTDIFKKQEGWPLQLKLATSPTKTTFIGIDSTGKLTLSYSDKDGHHDLVYISKADKVHFDRRNILQFIWFPSGYYFIKLNSYENWSFDYEEEKHQKIPFTGLGNKILFDSTIKYINFDLSYYKNDGEQVTFYDTRQLEYIGKLDSVGEKVGNWREYHKNGALRAIGPFSNNNRNGAFKVYHDNGNLFFNVVFQNDKSNGNVTVYNKNGSLKSIFNTKDDTLNGYYIEYYENGNIKSRKNYKNNEVIGEEEQFSENGERTNGTDSNKTPTSIHGDSNEFSDQLIKHYWNDSNKLNDLAWHIYLKHNEKNILEEGIKLVKRSIELSPNYYNLDTYASLLYKTGNYVDAYSVAVNAISIAKENGTDYSSTFKLAEQIIKKM